MTDRSSHRARAAPWPSPLVEVVERVEESVDFSGVWSMTVTRSYHFPARSPSAADPARHGAVQGVGTRAASSSVQLCFQELLVAVQPYS